MNGVSNRTNYTISLLRILACAMIVWNHMSGFMLEGFLNKWNWANTGVQIFFFMSGFLYGGRAIENRTQWIVKQSKKIYKPYYLSLVILIPLVLLLDSDSLNILNIVTAVLGLQGFGPQIDGLGQHWFVTYILVCYLLTAFLLSRLKLGRLGGGKFWFCFVLCALVFQIVTIPLAILIKFKAAYIMTYIIGYCYKARFTGGQRVREKKTWELVVVIGALFGIVIRYYLEDLQLYGVYESLSDMIVQYIKLLWGCAAFVLFNKLIPQGIWTNVSQTSKQMLVAVAGYTYEIYLIHEFFVHEPYISLFGGIGMLYKVLIALTSVCLATILLCTLEKVFCKYNPFSRFFRQA